MYKIILTKERKFNVKPFLVKWLVKASPTLKDFFQKENEYLKKVIKPDYNVLDVGCGFGKNIKVVAERAKKIVGIDYDKGVLGVAKKELKKYHNVNLFLENAKKMHFQDNTFDYVICMGNTFGNMLSIKLRVLNEMKRVTKRGGKIIISVFSKNALKTQIKSLEAAGFGIIKIKNSLIYTKQGLITERFTKLQLKRILNSANLKIKIIKLTPISYICEAIKEE